MQEQAQADNANQRHSLSAEPLHYRNPHYRVLPKEIVRLFIFRVKKFFR